MQGPLRGTSYRPERQGVTAPLTLRGLVNACHTHVLPCRWLAPRGDPGVRGSMRSTFLQGLPYITFVVNILTVRFTFADLPILQINDVQFAQGMAYPVQVTGNEFKVGPSLRPWTRTLPKPCCCCAVAFWTTVDFAARSWPCEAAVRIPPC